VWSAYTTWIGKLAIWFGRGYSDRVNDLHYDLECGIQLAYDACKFKVAHHWTVICHDQGLCEGPLPGSLP
jgi:hypothetical protein